MTYTVPAGLTFHSRVDAAPDATAGCAVCQEGSEVLWVLAANESRNILVSATVEATVPDGSVVRAPVQVTATDLTDTISIEKTVVVQ